MSAEAVAGSRRSSATTRRRVDAIYRRLAIAGEDVPLTRREALGAVAVLGLVALAVYGRHVVRGGWYYDDWALVAQLDVARDHGIGEVVRAAFDQSYRPGYSLAILVMYLIGGTGQAAYLAIGTALAALESVLAYAVVRMLGMPRLAAGAVASLLLCLPTIDATRLWTAAFPTTWAVCLYLVGVALALRGLRAGSKRAVIAWHTAALGAYAAAVLTSELVAPLVVLSGALYLAAGDRRQAVRRWLTDVAVGGGALAYLAGGAQSARPADTSLNHMIERGKEILHASRPVLRDAVPFDHVFWGPLGVIILVAAAVGVGSTLGGGDPSAGDVRRWIRFTAGSLVAALAGLAMLLPADSYYVPRTSGVGDRFTAAAALGEVGLVVGAAVLVAVGLAALIQRPAWAGLIATGTLAITAVSLASEEVRHQDPWAQSWTRSQKVISAVRRALGAELPHGSAIVTFHHPTILPGDVPVFAAPWDLRGALQLSYRDLSLAASPWFPSFTCDPRGLSLRSAYAPGGPVERLRYGSLFFVDAGAFTGVRVADRAGCRRAVARFTQ